MRLVERDQIDTVRWDQLVAQKGGLIFSKSVYLDAVAEQWSVFVDDDYSCGIALPYVIRLGKRSLYTPIFLRYLEWLGDSPPEGFFSLLRSKFAAADLSLRNKLENEESAEYVFQEIAPVVPYQYKDQAKRMIRKFERSDLKILETDDLKAIFRVISDELPRKIDSVNSKNLQSLFQLLENLSETGLLRALMVVESDQCVGGAFFIETSNRTIYLKSAFTEEAKKKGAMYGLMDQMISYSLDRSQRFDFGGSRVEGVKRFNHNLGALDVIYFNYKWNDMPFWYRFIKGVRAWLKQR